MALAETARLLATYEVQDKSAAGIRSATSGLTGLQSRARTFGTTLKTHVGGALTHFGGQLRSIASIGLASLGVAGLFGVVGAFKSVIGEAKEFGDTVYRLQAITGLSAESTSRLTDALGDFGVDATSSLRIAGMFEKNVERLGGTKLKAAAFEKLYGLQLRDSSGQLLNFNDQLLNSAAFFNDKTIPASQKAAGLAALYGRSWQTLIPILKQGRAGLQDTLNTSLTLSQADIKAIEENRVATRKWNDAIGDLQVKIGVGLLPTITELVTSLTGWVGSHGSEIQTFFRNGVDTAKAVGGAVAGVLGGIKAVWDGIPDPVKDLLIKGFVADRTVKFLFGFSLAGLAKDLAGGVAGGLGNAVVKAGIGKAFVQPVFVTNMGPGGLGGVGGGAGGVAAAGTKAGSVMGLLSKVLLVGLAAELAAEFAPQINHLGNEFGQTFRGTVKDLTGFDVPTIDLNDVSWPFGPKNTPTILPEIFGGNGLLGGTAAAASPAQIAQTYRDKVAADDFVPTIKAVSKDEQKRLDLIVAATHGLKAAVKTGHTRDEEKLDRVRSSSETHRRATQSLERTTDRRGEAARAATSAVGRRVDAHRSATVSGTDRVVAAVNRAVAAIRGISTSVNVNVSGNSADSSYAYRMNSYGGGKRSARR